MLLATAGCGILPAPQSPPGQAGSPAQATQGADAFLKALARHDAQEAWSHLTPATRQVVYNDDELVFAHDVATADWLDLAWEFGPVTDLDISWGVHVVVNEGEVPRFLVERQLAAGWEGFGIVLHVQTPVGQPYLVAGQGLDTRL